MLLRYLQPNNGHVNGTHWHVDSRTKVDLFLRIVVGYNEEKIPILLRLPCDPGNSSFLIPGFKKILAPISRLYSGYIQQNGETTVQKRSQNQLASRVLYEWPNLRSHVAKNTFFKEFSMFAKVVTKLQPILSTSLFFFKLVYSWDIFMRCKRAFPGFIFSVTYSSQKIIVIPATFHYDYEYLILLLASMFTFHIYILANRTFALQISLMNIYTRFPPRCLGFKARMNWI